MSELTMEAVRAKYPAPTTLSRWRKGGYCVGGAFLKCLPDPPLSRLSFPHFQALAVGLVQINPVLGLDRATDFAMSIAMHNDASQFERAWQILDEALRFGKEQPS